jgi:predicted RNase H-like HicB family nuclease
VIKLNIEIEQETGNRWLADVTNVPGAVAYGRTEIEAFRKVLTIVCRMLEEREPCSAT